MEDNRGTYSMTGSVGTEKARVTGKLAIANGHDHKYTYSVDSHGNVVGRTTDDKEVGHGHTIHGDINAPHVKPSVGENSGLHSHVLLPPDNQISLQGM